jgi:S-(hydroxymethyl)glutathione dehydrogenase / alcohol dehydrogenase
MTGQSDIRSLAAVLTEAKSDLKLCQVVQTNILTFGQVLVQVHYSGVCASQVHEIDGLKGPDPFLPHLLGHEGSGTVLEVGEGVRFIKPGDHVVMHWRPGNGIQSINPTYDWDGKTVNAGSVTTFNSHAVVSENRITCIPNWFDLRLAPLLGCAVTTAFGAIGNDAQVKIGESVVVFGVGGVGLAAVMAARLTTANPIIAIDLDQKKLDVALGLGATHVINARQQNTVEVLQDLLGEEGADVAIETTGVKSVIEMAYNICSPIGRTVLVGVPDPEDPASIPTLPLHFGKKLIGSHGGSSKPHIDIPRIVRLVEQGKLDLSAIPLTERPLSEINYAIADLRAGVPGRQLIRMS